MLAGHKTGKVRGTPDASKEPRIDSPAIDCRETRNSVLLDVPIFYKSVRVWLVELLS